MSAPVIAGQKGRRFRASLGVLYSLPALVLLLVFSVLPFLWSLRLAFYESNGLGFSEFAGLGNFFEIFTDSMFWWSAMILAVFVLLMAPIQTIGPLIGARLVYAVKHKFAASVYRAVFVLPVVIPMAVGVLIWRDLYSGDGAVNQLLTLVGLESWARSWLGDRAVVIPAIVFMGVPFVGGVNLLIYLAGFLNIPSSMHEAAAIEGASVWRVFFSIELPWLLPQIRLIVVLSLIGAIHSYEHILILTNGGPGDATLVPALYLFRHGFEYGNLGYACAVGVILFAVTLGLTLLNFRLTRSAGSHQ